MADMADVCEVDRDRQCDSELRQETEIDDPSIGIIPEIESGPVLAGPPMVTGPLTPCDIGYLQSNFRPLINFTDPTAAATAAQDYDAEPGPPEIEQRDREGFVESDEVSSNTTEDITTGIDNPLLVSFQIMEFIESQIKKDLFGPFNTVFEALYKGLLDVVPNLHDVNATKGFVGINRCGFLSKYTTVIYYAGRIPFSHRLAIVTLVENCNTHIKEIIEKWSVGRNIAFTCKVEKSPVQYDTQKIILYIRLATNNVIQISILNVVGFPVFEDVNPLLRLLGCVDNPVLHWFRDPRTEQCLSLLDIIVRVRLCGNRGPIAALSEPSKEEVTLILSCFPVMIPKEIATVLAYQKAAMDASHPWDAFTISKNLIMVPDEQKLAYTQQEETYSGAVRVEDTFTSQNYFTIMEYQQDAIKNQNYAMDAFKNSLYDDFRKHQHAAIVSQQMVQQIIAQHRVARHAYTITQSIRTTLYTVDNIKSFALFCNIFYNFINVSLGFRSLAKIIYSDFFGTSDNYGKVIRTCQVVNNLPIMRDHVKCLLTGSNAARVYLALNKILKNWEAIQHDPRLLTQILNETFGNLSDNDFMIYLKGPESEEYRVFIRMILGGSFYFFKDLFDPRTLAEFTAMMTQSAGIVGFMDHLFAQRFDATWQFLWECYKKYPTSFLARIQPLMAEYFQHLDKQINVAHLDGVFKHYTLKGFYTKMFEICGITAPDYVYDFLINYATSINCIATVWTLVLNVLYTLFVPENCLARMVVGKFDNDPKNLKLYMEILNDHLTELQSLPIYGGTTGPGIALHQLLIFQTEIASMCQHGINHGPDVFKAPEFKKTCVNWVQTMVTCVSQTTSKFEFRGLFMLSESDASTQGGRPSTNLERALCLAYYPTQQGNICSAASIGTTIFSEKLQGIITSSSLSLPMDIVSTVNPEYEVNLRDRLTRMGEKMEECFVASNTDKILPTPYVKLKYNSKPEPEPEGTSWPLSTYFNHHWKYLTKTAIRLKIFFNENLTDIKRVTGIKYIALVLGGYFQIRLLVDDVSDQCPDADKRAELESFKTSREMIACKRGLLPLLIHPHLITLIKAIIQMDRETGTDYTVDPVPLVLKILGFLFSIKVKSSSPHSSNTLLGLEDSMLRFKNDFPKDSEGKLVFNVDEKGNLIFPFTKEILRPTEVMFFQFLIQLGISKEHIKCICSSKYNTKLKVAQLDYEILSHLNSGALYLYEAVGGSNDSDFKSGRKSVYSLNKHKHKYKYNKLARNNHTHRNKNKRRKNSNSNSKSSYNSNAPSYNNKKHKQKSQSNRKKSKSKLPQKNVTFKRRRYNK